MKKLLPIFVVIILVLSGLGAVALTEKSGDLTIKTEKIFFSNPLINEEDQYTVINVENTNSWVDIPNKPMLPAYIKTFEFPFGTKIKEVKVTLPEIESLVLSKKVIPSSEPVLLLSEMESIKETEIDSVRENTKRLIERYRSKKITRTTYERLRKDYARDLQKSMREIDRIILELREEIR